MGCTDNNDVKLALCQGTIALLNAANGGSPDKCKTPALSGAICGTATSTGTNPFAPICSDATGNSDFANILTRQVAYCVDNASASGCEGAISSFCQTAEGRKSQTLCPAQYTPAVRATVIATDWATTARNATDNTGVSVLDAVGANDARTSYINAIARTNGRGTFDFNGGVNGVDGVSIIQDSLLLSDFNFVEDDIGGADGFAFARVDNPDFTDNPDGALDAKARFYAGLLTTTNLGAPLTDTSADGIWDAVFAAVVSDSKPACDPNCDTDQNPNYREVRSGRLIETSSTVDVSFADKTIKTREVDADFTPDPTDFELDGDRITIDGKFNADGVIFGTSSWIYDRQTSHGSVSGLIGSKGAVGAFVSNGQNNGEDSNGEYAGGFIASNRCLVAPFLAACVHESFNGLRAARIALCRDDLQSTNPLCLQAGVVAAVCVADGTPFAVICGDNMAEKDSYCRDTAPSGDAKCDPTRTGRICGAGDSPFADICITEADNNVENQREFCRTRNPNDGTCQPTIWAFCGTPTSPTPANVNLFDSLCDGDYNVARGVACLAGYSDGNCGDDKTPDSYIHAYCTADSEASRNNARHCGNTDYLTANPVNADDRVTVDTLRNKALNGQGTARLVGADGTDATAFILASRASLADADANYILGRTNGLYLGARIATADRQTLTLDGIGNSNNTISGFAIATGNFIDSGARITKHYVGLLSGTNLGAPLIEAPQESIWDAKVSVRTGQLFNLTLEKDFKLKVDFAGKSIKTVNDQGVSWTHGLLHNPIFTIRNGKFTANGVIYGTTNFFANSINSFGTLTGLIGSGGAVGIFKSNPNVTDNNYVGGFVAAPPDTANFADWEASFANGGVNSPEPLHESGFVSGTDGADYIKLDTRDKIVVNSQTLTTTIVRLNETAGQDGYESGFAYAYDHGNRQAYVGLLSTTNVGRALTSQTPAKTIWSGRMAGIAGPRGNTAISSNLSLEVHFGAGNHAGTIRTLDNGNPGRAFLTGVGTFDVNGNFNTDGVMWGSVSLNRVGGAFSGLIGERGAVGVFNGTGSDINDAYSGGFVVKPPRQ